MEDRLQKFAVVVECGGSVTHAAKRLHVSQPALTTAIHKLERELGVLLLERDGRVNKVTAAGFLTYKAAKNQALVLTNLRHKLSDLHGQRPQLTIGMIDSVAEMISICGDSFTELEEQADASIVINNSSALLTAVERGELDGAFIVKQQQLPTGVVMRHIGDEILLLVSALGSYNQLTTLIRSAAPIPFIAYNHSSTTFQLGEVTLRRLQIPRNIIFSSTSPDMMLRLVQKERGAAILPYLLTKELIADKKICLLRKKLIKRPIVWVQQKERYTAPATLRLQAQASEILQSLQKQASLLAK